MFCPECGTENNDDARFCKSCGNPLEGGITTPIVLDATVRSSSVEVRKDDSVELKDGLCLVLTEGGLKLLDQPSRLRALVADYCDHGTREYVVFEHNCTAEFLAPFAAVAQELPDERALDEATARAYLALRRRSIEDKSARDVCACVRNAVAHCMGVREVPAHAIDFAMDPYAEDPYAEDPYAEYEDEGYGFSSDSLPNDYDAGVSEAPLTQAYGPVSYNQRPYDLQSNEPLPPEAPPLEPFQQDAPQKKLPHPALLVIALALIVAIIVLAFFLFAGGSQGSDSSEGDRTEQVDSGEQDADGDQAADEKKKTDGKEATDDKKATDDEKATDGKKAEKPATVTISFSGGKDAKGAMDSAVVEKGSTYTLPKCAYTREGYVFECWVGNNGSEYTPGDMAAANTDLTFRAQWAKEKEEEPEPEPEPEPSRANPAAAASFPRLWSGVYQGWVSRSESIDRQVSFDFTSVSDEGDLVGVCYVGVAQAGTGATYASYNVRGTVDWNSGDIYVYGTSWIEQGGLGDLRQYKGSVDFENRYVAGRASDVDTGDYDGYWRMSAVSQLSVNRPVSTPPSDSSRENEKEPEPEREHDSDNGSTSTSKADSFSRTWRGSYEGWTSHISGDDTISRAITFEFSSVSDDGTLEGVCYVGVDDDVPGATNASYYIRGEVDWNTGVIFLKGTSWINQGGLDDLRQYEGTVDFDRGTMGGTASDVGTHAYEGAFFMEA
ncbi:MAG: zinc-ribbon domain-containing protein [Atopobiaceae bacterium]|nr:zinc-ribbon domain-containing protein [Atopobiaceae bacterium]